MQNVVLLGIPFLLLKKSLLRHPEEVLQMSDGWEIEEIVEVFGAGDLQLPCVTCDSQCSIS